MGERGALAAHRRGVLSDLAAWITATLGQPPRDLSLYDSALTSATVDPKHNYQRLEFLGDRVLGLIMARWLYERYPHEREGALSHRFMRLVSGAVCAEVAREMGVAARLRLNKQGFDDGLSENVNLLGDVAESLIAAVYLDHGVDAAQAVVRRYWADRVNADLATFRSPKSLLLEWADAHKRKPPVYRVVTRTGPDHAPRFVVAVGIALVDEAEAEGRSKHEAETAAAAALLVRLT